MVVLFSSSEGGSTNYQSTNTQADQVEEREAKDSEKKEKKEESKHIRKRLKRKAVKNEESEVSFSNILTGGITTYRHLIFLVFSFCVSSSGYERGFEFLRVDSSS